jgi:outer membrane receptor for ferrienterochelin and colicins
MKHRQGWRRGLQPGLWDRLERSALAVSILCLALGLASQALGTVNDLPTSDLAKLSIEELMQIEIPTVVGASKHEQKVTEAPASVTIVTAEDIKRYGYRTLADVLNSVPGFYTTYDRLYNYAGVRGVNRPGDFGGRLLITVDGHRMNDPIFDQAPIGTDFILDLDLVERVEIIRGPGSSLYGNNAFFGVINVVTRRSRDLKGIEASTSVASYDTVTGRLTWGDRLNNGLEILLSGTLQDSEGHDRLYYPEFQDVNNGVTENNDGSRFQNLFLKLAYGEFSLESAYVDRRKDDPTAGDGIVFNQPGNYIGDERAYVQLSHRHVFADGTEVASRLYYDVYKYTSDYLFDYEDPEFPGRIIVNRDVARSKSVGGEMQASRNVFQKHRLTAGAEYRHDFSLEQRNYDMTPPGTTYGDSNPSADTVGFYLQDEIPLMNRLTLNAGIRYDYFDSFVHTLNPRTALLYTPWTNGVFKFLYGQAYRAPNAYERFTQGSYYKINPDLGPETIRSYELVYEQILNASLRFNTSLFYNDAEDQITFGEDPADGMFRYANTDQVYSRGAEAEVDWRGRNGVSGNASYTYAETEDQATGDTLSNSPRHVGKFHYSVPLWTEKLMASLELLGVSERKTVQGNESAGYWIANLTLLSREVAKGLELSASIYNLFDRAYADPVSDDFTQDTIEQDGRTFRVKATYKF